LTSVYAADIKADIDDEEMRIEMPYTVLHDL